jgi:hypothetical protein
MLTAGIKPATQSFVDVEERGQMAAVRKSKTVPWSFECSSIDIRIYEPLHIRSDPTSVVARNQAILPN